jgi:hypothetical protein
VNTTSAASKVLRGEELLALGQYAEGFRLYDAWRELHPEMWTKIPVPRWQGEKLTGQSFLITGEQGYGDQIMAARFAKLLQDAGANPIWMCDPGLDRLFNQCAEIKAFSRESGGDHLVSLHCPSSGLPNLFFPPLTEPPSAPYIKPPAPVRSGHRIGVVTSGNPKHPNDAARSIPADVAAILLNLPGALDLRPENTGARDFYETAAIIAGLDLVIAVDTSVAHLAGAMGWPVWVLLPHVADWRWMKDRSDSPWYPSARLFRQPSPGDWASVLMHVQSTLGH